MSIVDTIALIQSLNTALPSIESAPTEYPASINTASLPLALCRPGPGRNYTMDQGSDMLVEERLYIVEVFVLPVSQGVLVDEGMQKLISIIDELNTAYRPGVELDDETIIMNNDGDIADTGSTVHLVYGSVPYHGVVFSIKVQTITSGE